jgi:hypothetical protein
MDDRISFEVYEMKYFFPIPKSAVLGVLMG